MTITETVDHIMWNLGTFIMIFNLALCITFVIITNLATKQHREKLKLRPVAQSASSTPSHFAAIYHKLRPQQECIAYFFYSFAFLCAIQCFMCHYSIFIAQMSFASYCRWAAPVCVVIYFSAKTALYGFFLERAKLSQGLLNTFPARLFSHILPLYIFVYWLIWSICIMIFFEGAPDGKVTSCIISTYKPWLLTAAGFVDVFNTLLFLFLFIYPLQKAYAMNKEAFDNNAAKKRNFISMMWYNVVLSAICSISSYVYLFLIPVISGYSRMGEQLDMMINSICVFLMLATNRSYVRALWNRSCRGRRVDGEDTRKGGIPQRKGYETVETTTTTRTGTAGDWIPPDGTELLEIDVDTDEFEDDD